MISHNLLLNICFYILSFSIAFASVTANWNWDFGQRSILFIFVQFNSEPFSKLKAFLCQIRWEHFNREWTRIFWSHFNLATTWQNLFFRFQDTFKIFVVKLYFVMSLFKSRDTIEIYLALNTSHVDVFGVFSDYRLPKIRKYIFGCDATEKTDY